MVRVFIVLLFLTLAASVVSGDDTPPSEVPFTQAEQRVCWGAVHADYYRDHPRYSELAELQRYVVRVDPNGYTATGMPYTRPIEEICRQAKLMRGTDRLMCPGGRRHLFK